jgi:hypothetical protein
VLLVEKKILVVGYGRVDTAVSGCLGRRGDLLLRLHLGRLLILLLIQDSNEIINEVKTSS